MYPNIDYNGWPDIPFDESMLGLESGVIIHCPNKDLVNELFDILRMNGVRWYGGESMTETYWGREKYDTCYRVKNGQLWCGDVFCYNGIRYNKHKKCRFHGVVSDIEISDASFEGIISAGR